MIIYGKKRTLKTLGDYSRSGRMPHALLYYGAEGIGKRTLADYTAMMYLCRNKQGGKPCMECAECRRVEAHIHPDVAYPVSLIENKTDKNKSNVDVLRDFITSCYVKPNDGDVRVVIFEKLDTLSEILQNSLLKFIEEPLDFNRYIFTAENKNPILQTVLSRVTAVEVDGADEEEFTDALTDLTGKPVGSAGAAELYRRFGGNIGAALSFESKGEETGSFTAAVNAAGALAARKETDFLVALLALKKREELFEALGVLTDILAGASAVKAGKAPDGVHSALQSSLSSVYSLKVLSNMYREAVRLYGYSSANPNVRLFAAECCSSLFRAAEGAVRK